MGGPWSFDRQLISLVKPKGLGEITKMEFNKVSFWVQIGNVPLGCTNRACVVK